MRQFNQYSYDLIQLQYFRLLRDALKIVIVIIYNHNRNYNEYVATATL